MLGALLHKSSGPRQKHPIDEVFDFENLDGQTFTARVKGRVEFLKLPHEVNVQLHDVETSVPSTCNRCLKPFTQTISIPVAEREFIIDLEEREMTPGEEGNFVNKERDEIDITPMLREELLLHFPPIPLCSESCKGLCYRCGANLNETTCSCPKPTDGKISPFKLLKD